MTHRLAEAVERAVDDAASGDAQRQMRVAIVAIGPAEAITVVDEVERTRRRERKPGAPFDFVFEPFEPAIIDGVFQPCALAHFAIAEVALRRHYRFGDR